MCRAVQCVEVLVLGCVLIGRKFAAIGAKPNLRYHAAHQKIISIVPK